MTKSDGKCRINAIEVGEVSVNALGLTPAMVVKYALTESETGTRFGAGHMNQWSEKTISLLSELLTSIEADVAKDLFGDSGTTSSVLAPAPDPMAGVPSL